MTEERTEQAARAAEHETNGGMGNGGMSAGESTDNTEEQVSPEDALRREAEDHRDRALRIAAELDNFRKRSARELESARKFGAERLAQSLLPVRDSIEAGIEAAAAAGAEAIVEGQRATLRLLDDALAQAGVTVIEPQGEPFDPSRHEALSMVPAPNMEPNSVVEVILKGYQMHDRLLRAARVLVARAPDDN